MHKSNDFLVEIQTAELPPKSLHRLAAAFLSEIIGRLSKAGFAFQDAQFFATPRRLAVMIKALAAEQPESIVERKGPGLDAAFDANGKPTPACLGFARSCGITPEQFTTIKNPQGEWVGYLQTVPGKHVKEILPEIIQQSLTALPIPKRMRWGNHATEFVRPVHSAIMLYGDDIIDAEILGCHTGRSTRGHRFHYDKLIDISNPSEYVARLENPGYVIVDFERRKKIIAQQAKEKQAGVVMTEALLDEVTGLVEWPVAVCGSFDEKFLAVPQEALISAMQDHQRYFPVIDKQGKLLPHFVTISNIESKNPNSVISGNERVLRARLSDAAFFFKTDKKHTLTSRVGKLKYVIFQAKLGTLYDKAERISQLAEYIAKKIEINVGQAKHAGLLAKADLVTEIVNEFPELQGIAGYYYALHDGEDQAVAIALKEQYMPRFSGDALPDSLLGCALAIADRLDALVGVFGINQQPTGDKDPFGLRRAALGVLRIIIEKKLNLDLYDLIKIGAQNYQAKLANPTVSEQVLSFMKERLKPWYQEQHITPDVFAAVAALAITCPYDMHCRIQAVQAFKKLPEAESLSVANKRVSNILAKYTDKIDAVDINANLFETNEERELAKKLAEQNTKQTKNYGELLTQLANLRQPVDNFFEKVLVMSDDKAIRENRLLMLKKLRELFLQVADIALLQ